MRYTNRHFTYLLTYLLITPPRYTNSSHSSHRSAIHLPWGSVEHTESFKYLEVELTSNMSDSMQQLSRDRGVFKSVSKVLCSTTMPVKLRVKLLQLQTLNMPIFLYGCERWTLSRAYEQTECLSDALPTDDSSSLCGSSGAPEVVLWRHDVIIMTSSYK